MKTPLNTLVLRRLATYTAKTDVAQINAAKEIIQELALFGLSRNGLFKVAAFHGGTCLRIFYGLERFSEDLDFVLIRADPAFTLETLLRPLQAELMAWGIALEVVDRSKADSNVKKAFLKTDSLGAVLELQHPLNPKQKFIVKLEIDTNPPQGAILESKLCEFPADFYAVCHDQPSLFSGKLHALLCRQYLKGRDWFDLANYLSWKSDFNVALLRNSLQQVGPYVGTTIAELDYQWVVTELSRKVAALDISKMVADTLPFVENKRGVELWSKEYFIEKLEMYARHKKRAVA